MAFSPDGRLLAAQGGSPEWNLVLWVWEKSKVVTSVKTTNAAGNPVFQVLSLFACCCMCLAECFIERSMLHLNTWRRQQHRR